MVRLPRLPASGIEATGESHRVTVVELFFDLVVVFAFTQVTDYMLDNRDPVGVAQGLVVLGLMWWSWVAYGWLANQTRVDQGLPRIGMWVAMTAVFVVAVAFPEVLDDREGNLNGPLVLTVAYLVLRYTQVGIALIAARADEGLRREVLWGAIPTVAGSAFVVAGVLIGGSFHTVLWLLAIVIDVGLTYIIRTREHWRIHSPAHWVDRFSCVILLALGESIVAAGVAATEVPMGTEILAACIVAIVLAVGFWATYYLPNPYAAEHVLAARSGKARTALATEGYAYLHFPMIAGIILSALGIEAIIDHLAKGMPIQLFGAAALLSGIALYLAAHAAYWRRVMGSWRRWQLGGGLLLIALIPVALAVGTLGALCLAAVVTIAIVLVQNRVWQVDPVNAASS